MTMKISELQSILDQQFGKHSPMNPESEIVVVDRDGFVFDIEAVGFVSAVDGAAITVRVREDKED